MCPEEERICCDACLTAYLTVTLAVPFHGGETLLAGGSHTLCIAATHTAKHQAQGPL